MGPFLSSVSASTGATSGCHSHNRLGDIGQAGRWLIDAPPRRLCPGSADDPQRFDEATQNALKNLAIDLRNLGLTKIGIEGEL